MIELLIVVGAGALAGAGLLAMVHVGARRATPPVRIPSLSNPRASGYAPRYSAFTRRAFTHADGCDEALLLCIQPLRGRRPVAIAQLDPVDADEFADEITFARGSYDDLAAAIDGALAVCKHVADGPEGWARDRAAGALARLAYAVGDSDERVQ